MDTCAQMAKKLFDPASLAASLAAVAPHDAVSKPASRSRAAAPRQRLVLQVDAETMAALVQLTAERSTAAGRPLTAQKIAADVLADALRKPR